MQLSADELASVRLAVDEAGVTDFVVPYDPTFHSSDGMTVLQAIRTDGSLVDIAVVALNTPRCSLLLLRCHRISWSLIHS